MDWDRREERRPPTVRYIKRTSQVISQGPQRIPMVLTILPLSGVMLHTDEVSLDVLRVYSEKNSIT